MARSDALYHNFEHTLQVTMVGRDILKGMILSQRIEPTDVESMQIGQGAFGSRSPSTVGLNTDPRAATSPAIAAARAANPLLDAFCIESEKQIALLNQLLAHYDEEIADELQRGHWRMMALLKKSMGDNMRTRGEQNVQTRGRDHRHSQADHAQIAHARNLRLQLERIAAAR